MPAMDNNNLRKSSVRGGKRFVRQCRHDLPNLREEQREKRASQTFVARPVGLGDRSFRVRVLGAFRFRTKENERPFGHVFTRISFPWRMLERDGCASQNQLIWSRLHAIRNFFLNSAQIFSRSFYFFLWYFAFCFTFCFCFFLNWLRIKIYNLCIILLSI